MKRPWLLSLAFLLTLKISAQEVDFFREDLQFRLDKQSFEVEGDYYFRNNTSGEIRKLMLYPFPDTRSYGEITSISIHIKGDTASQVISSSEKGALFRLLIPPDEEIVYHIRYSQQLLSDEAKYIITTTQRWGKPFERASYSLEVSPDLVLTSSSIAPDRVSDARNERKYSWNRENFMPEADFIFSFRKTGGK